MSFQIANLKIELVEKLVGEGPMENSDKSSAIEREAAILKKIDEQLKDLSPELRKEAFQLLVQRHLLGPSRVGSTPRNEQTAKKNRGKRSLEQPAIVKDLNLKADSSIESLRDFWKRKRPDGFLEQNAVFVYYLSMLKRIENISQDHVYTCYKDVAARIPGAFYQSLLDTSRRKGWIDTKNMQNIRVTTVGENFVEHDLPAKEKG